MNSVAISPDGGLVASTGFTDQTVRLWDLKSGACLQVIKHDGEIFPISVAFSPKDSRLVVGTTYYPIYVYQLIHQLTRPKAALPAELTRRYVNAKVVLIGESTVGKTTLAHRLIEECYIKTDSTHGMNVSRLDLPLEPDEAMEREALLWDLAGQEDYRLIHQLYLEETALAAADQSAKGRPLCRYGRLAQGIARRRYGQRRFARRRQVAHSDAARRRRNESEPKEDQPV